MATSSGFPTLTATPPADTVHGPDGSLFMTMTGLGPEPATGRLLRGLEPYLDEQNAEHVFLLVERKRKEEWRGPGQAVRYQELVHWQRGEAGGTYRGVCARENGLEHSGLTERFRAEPLGLIDWAAEHMRAAVVSSTAPLRLDTRYVEKPWGRECWYTGIEKRGVSCVESATGKTELPYALGMFPLPLMGEAGPAPILLKTLEPRPEPVLGDLYLEVHEEKWETYLVLEVDPKAWPDGTGCLRAGLDKRVWAKYRKRYGSRAEQALARELGEKIGAYEKVRREIDALVDEALAERGHGSTEIPPASLLKQIHKALPAKLKTSEARLRAEAESFIGRHPMKVGDVACLPPGVLHSLQHGVKVVEFQTPTYERLIAMFAQKVVTQPHWDTEQALALMEKAPYTPPATEPLESRQRGVHRDRVVDFPQFQVLRTHLGRGVEEKFESGGERTYRLLFTASGRGRLLLPDGSATPLAPGDACLLPAVLGEFTIEAGKKEGLTYLTARPRLDDPS